MGFVKFVILAILSVLTKRVAQAIPRFRSFVNRQQYIHWCAHCAGFKVYSCRSMSLRLPRFVLRRRRICNGRLQIMV